MLTLVGFILFILYITNNLFENVEQRGIRTGFDFLSSTAGFGISETLVEYDESMSYARVFLVGMLNTLLVAFIGIILATMLGLIIGVSRLSSNWLIAKIATVYIELFRNIPILLQILFWYNVVLASLPSPRQSISFFESIFISLRGCYVPKPIAEEGFFIVWIAIAIAIGAVIYLSKWAKKRQDETGEPFPVLPVSIGILLGLPLLVYFLSGSPLHLENPELKGFNFKGGIWFSPEFIALTFALSIYTATYIAEAIRSGIEAVPKGQKEAAKSLGLTPYQELKLVVLPQAVRVAIPPTINQYLNLTKNSSLATAIGYPEIVTVFSGTALNQSGQAIEIIFMTMLVYLTISLAISGLLNWFNAKVKIKER